MDFYQSSASNRQDGTCHSEEQSKPALSKVEGKNLVPQAKNEMLRGVYPERSRRAQHDSKILTHLLRIEL